MPKFSVAYAHDVIVKSADVCTLIHNRGSYVTKGDWYSWRVNTRTAGYFLPVNRRNGSIYPTPCSRTINSNYFALKLLKNLKMYV